MTTLPSLLITDPLKYSYLNLYAIQKTIRLQVDIRIKNVTLFLAGQQFIKCYLGFRRTTIDIRVPTSPKLEMVVKRTPFVQKVK